MLIGHLTSAPSGLSSSPQLVRLQKLKTPPGFNRRITCALVTGDNIVECIGTFALKFSKKPDEVEMMSVPLSISERVSVIEDPVKVARRESRADLLVLQWKTELQKMHDGPLRCIDWRLGNSLLVEVEIHREMISSLC